jgi:hypothetical protein
MTAMSFYNLKQFNNSPTYANKSKLIINNEKIIPNIKFSGSPISS